MRLPSPTLAILTGAAMVAAVVHYVPGIRVVDGDTVDHAWWRWRIAGPSTPRVLVSSLHI